MSIRTIINNVFINCLFVVLLAYSSLSTAGSNELDWVRGIIGGFQPTEVEKQAGAVIVHSESVVELAGRDSGESVTTIIIALLDNDAVKDYGTINESFNSYFYDTSIDYSYAIDRSGKVHELTRDAVQVKTKSSALSYGDQKTISFANPGLESGGFIAYRLRSKLIKPIVAGHWFRRAIPYYGKLVEHTGKYRMDPVRFWRFAVTHDADVSINYLSANGIPEPRKNHEGGKRQTFSWQMRDLPACKIEDKMGTAITWMPYVDLSTLQGWNELDAWGAQLYLSGPGLDSMPGEFASITRGKSRRETIEAIYYYMQDNIRYINADVTRGGVTPHSPEEVLSNRFGDCKDQSVLLVNLLKHAGIESYPALTSFYPESEVNAELPAMLFSHMIVYIPGEDEIWIDPSGNSGKFPGLDWTLEGRPAFIVNNKGGELRQIQPDEIDQNLIEYIVEYDLVTKPPAVQVRLIYEGSIGNRIKSLLKNSSEAETEFSSLFVSMFSDATLESFEINDVRDSRQRLEMLARLRLADWDNAQSFTVSGNISPVFALAGLQSLPSPEIREHDYHFGPKLTLKFLSRVPLPGDEYKPLIDDLSESVVTGNIQFNKTITSSPTEIDAQLQFDVTDPVVRNMDYRKFYNAMADIKKKSQWTALLKIDESYRNISRTHAAIAQDGQSVESLLQLAEEYNRRGDYSNALKYAKEAVEVAPDHGKANYILGITHGFMDNFDELDLYTGKASELGYSP